MRLVHRDQWELLFTYLILCNVAASLPTFLDSKSGLAMEFPRCMVLGDFLRKCTGPRVSLATYILGLFWLVKASKEVACGLIQAVINASFQKRVAPPALKDAVVHPLFKRLSFEPIVLGNIHVVSSLPFLGKIVEKVVGAQLQRTLDETDYPDSFRSGFRSKHSIEMVLMTLGGFGMG